MLKQVEIDKTWSFSDKTIKDTAYITHGYYTYPAKFIPQLAQRLILENTTEGDIIIDPFSGSGTTVLESIIHKRIGIGTDINEIATLIAKVKTTPINLVLAAEEMLKLQRKIGSILEDDYEITAQKALQKIPKVERIDFWYKPEAKKRLAILLVNILEINDIDVRDFFLVAFAQILKTCSIWMQKSVKPTRDLKKKDYDPFSTFFDKAKKMLRKHSEFNDLLNKEAKSNIDKIGRAHV